MGARVRQRVTTASLLRWARPGQGFWEDWMTPAELAAAGDLAPVTLLHRLVAALDIWREHGGPDWEAAGLQPTYPCPPSGGPAAWRQAVAVRRSGGPPAWLRDAARDRAQTGGHHG